MHKEEASLGFQILSNPNNVKIAKMLYNRGPLDFETLSNLITNNSEELILSLKIMGEGNLIHKTNSITYEINKAYVDELLDFIRTPCGCTRK